MSDYIDFIDSNGSEWTRTNRFRGARETIAAQAAEIAQLKEQVKFVQSESFRTQAVSAQTFPTSAGDGDENTGNPNMYHESRNCLECLNREVDAQTEKIQAQAAVIEKLLEALTKIATARIGKPERWAHALFSDEKIAVEALATPSDSTQILAEVRRAEREKCAKVCDRLSRKEKDHAAGYGFGYLTYTADDCAAAIRAME